LLRVLIPIAAPGIAAAAAFAFMLSYSEFMFAVFLTKTEASHTAPVVLANIAINYDISYSLLAAAVVLTVLPTILIALVFRNYIRRGLALMGTG
jgi:multiple sugar transport system permease protein